MKYFILSALFMFVRFSCQAQPYPDVEVVNLNSIPGKNISRTMHLLESSTAEFPNEVRIMVYGQSITRMDWWLAVRDYLSEKYPTVLLDMENFAIGGFNAERLIRCVERDVLDFYPDLIIFHDYGGEETYGEIIRMFRTLTTAEVMILNDHVGIGQNSEWHDRHSWEWLPALCEKYGLELVDVRTNWINFAEKNGFDFQDLLKDHVHMNELGNYLMAGIIKAHLVVCPQNVSDSSISVKKLMPQDAFSGDGESVYAFRIRGNRMDLVYSQEIGVTADQIYINHFTAKEFQAFRIPSRVYLDETNTAYPEKIGIPVRIMLRNNPEEGHWNMVVKNVELDGYRIFFDLFSGHEGFQGSGDNLNDFCSMNGEICLKPEDWFYREEPGFFSPWKAVKTGDTIRFDIKHLNHVVEDPASGKKRQIIKGLPDGINILKLNGSAVKKFGNGLDIIVYDPPMFDMNQR